jgi:TP901 family phage tail tape measure protein
MPSIADLFVTVTSDVSGAISGLTSVDQKVNGTSAAMSAAAPAGYALAGAATAVGAAFLTSVSQATDFEHQINGIKSVMSPTEVNEFGDAVRALALALGKDTVFTSSQAADAIETLIKAGVPLPAILSGAARSALDLASATGTDVTLAAELASTAMNAYHLSASQLPGIMDTISNISNATATSVGSLKFALAAVGPVANGLGISFTDTATAIGIFANNGLVGSDAGTSLKTMLLNLEPSTKAQKAAFDALGITTNGTANQFFDAEGKAKPLNQIFQILKDSTSNLTQEQKINLLQTAFGTDAVRAATIAANEGAAGWDTVTASMEKMGGTQVAAAQRNSGLTGSMNQLGGSFEAIQIQIGTLFLPVLTRLADGLTILLNAFLTLDPNVQVAIVAIVGITGVVAALLAAFILLEPVLAAVDAAFGIIGVAAAGVALPIAALVAVGALLYQAWQTNFGGIRDVTAQVWGAIQPAFINIGNFLAALPALTGSAFSAFTSAVQPLILALEPFVAGILAQLPGLVRAAGDEFNTLGQTLGRIGTIFQALVASFTTDTGAMGIVVAQIRAIFGDAVADALEPFIQWFRDAIPAIQGFVNTLLPILSNFGLVIQKIFAGDLPGALDTFMAILGALGQQFGPLVRSFVDWIGPLIPPFLQALGQLALSLLGWAASQVGPLLAQLAVWGQQFINWIGPMIPPFLGALGQLLLELGAWMLGTALPAIVGHLAQWTGAFLGWIGENVIPQIGPALGNLLSAIADVIGQLPSVVAPAWDAFTGWFGSVLSGLPQFVGDVAGDIWAGLRTAFDGLPGQLAPAWDAFAGWLGSVLGGIPQFVADMAGDVWVGLRIVFGGLVDQLAPAWDAFAGWLQAVVGGIAQFVADNMGDIWGGITAAFFGLVDNLAPAWDAFAGWLGSVLAGLPQFVADHIGDVWGALVAAFTGSTPGGATSGGTGGTPAPTPIGSGGGGGITGPLVSINTINVGSVAEQDAFLQMMSDAILAAAQRLTTPPPASSPFLP